MQGQSGEQLREFFRADVFEAYRLQVDKKNMAMLCIVNLAIGMYSLMMYGHTGALTAGGRGFLDIHALLFFISAILFFINQKVTPKRTRLIPWMILLNYVLWASYIVIEHIPEHTVLYVTSYCALMAIGCCFLIKPLYLAGLQLGSTVYICLYMELKEGVSLAGVDTRIIILMLVMSIVLGFVILFWRMLLLKKNGETEQMMQVKALYQSVLDETQTGVYVRQLHTHEILFVNRKVCEIFGVDEERVIGQKCYDVFFHENNVCQMCPVCTNRPMQEEEWEITVCERIYTVKGKIGEWGGCEAYIEYLTDVTDARHVAEQMRTAYANLEKKYEEALLYREKAVSEDIFSTSRVNLTEKLVEELRVGKEDGYEKEYHHTMSFEERLAAFCRRSWLTEEQNEKLSCQELLKQFEAGVTNVYEEFIAELNGGRHVWIRAEATMVQRPSTGEVMAFIYNRDITRERLLGHVLEHIMSFEYDEIYTIDSHNLEYEMIAVGQQTFTYRQVIGNYQDKVNSLLESAASEVDRKILSHELSLKNMCRILRGGKSHLFDVTLVSKSREKRRKRISCMYLYEDVGMIMITIADIEDVVKSEKEKQEQLERALKLARQASEAKSNFLASMSHEIRTPMNIIIGLNSIIKDNIDNPKQVLDYSEKLDSTSKYLLALLNDILDMSRIESGNMTLAYQPFSGDKLWENINVLANTQASLANVKYIFERRQKISGVVYVGDATRLQQIMINLINNAIKFSSENGFVKVCVHELVVPDGRASINMTVEDNGIGISEEFLPEVFDTFKQEHVGSTTAYKGSGLGLSIAYRFAEMMGGDIMVESKEGMGTKFTVQIFLDMDTESTLDTERMLKARARTFEGKHVLLAEDHPLNIVVAKNMLEKKGFEVSCAENGEEAVRHFAESAEYTYDAILMDIRMPLMDGIEAAKQIRSLERADAAGVPIIAMTANAYEEDRRQTAEAGMDAHLAKPIDPEQLFGTLDALLP